MSESKLRQNTGKSMGAREAWGSVFCWTGIYLLRLIIGLAAGAIVATILLTIRQSYSAEDSQGWSCVAALLILVLAIASATFLPLWRSLEKANFRGRSGAVAATRILLVPAIVLQLFVALRGGLGLGALNFLVVVGVCFLVSLARDFDRRSQFVLLLIGGAQAIVMFLVSMLLDPMTPIDGWQIKISVWLGAVPPIVLMAILYRGSAQDTSGSSPERNVHAKEGRSQ